MFGKVFVHTLRCLTFVHLTTPTLKNLLLFLYVLFVVQHAISAFVLEEILFIALIINDYRLLKVGTVEYDVEPTEENKEQYVVYSQSPTSGTIVVEGTNVNLKLSTDLEKTVIVCLLYTSDAADE